jgi:hypothetical protein
MPRLVLTPGGVGEIEVASAMDHMVLDRHWEASAWFLATGDARPLACFKRLALMYAYPLAVEADDLRRWPLAVSEPTAAGRLR